MSSPLLHKRLRNSIYKASWKDEHALVVELAKQYLALHPHGATVWLSLGHALTELSRYEEAEQALTVELAPGFETLQRLFWRERGHLERRRGDLLKARQWLELSLEADSAQEDVFVRVELGHLALRLGALQEAESHFRSALDDGNFESQGADFFRLGEVLVAQNRIEEAVHCLRQAAMFSPKSKIVRTKLRELEQVMLFRLIREHPI